MKIALYSRELKPSSHENITTILNKLLHKKEISISLHVNLIVLEVVKEQKNNLNFFNRLDELEKIDYIICFGGDGTMLDTVNSIHNKNIPLIGINSGRLGFLTNIGGEHIETCFEDILFKNQYCVEDRMLLELQNKIKGVNNNALNEITVQKANSANLIIIHAYVNGKFLSTYWADGLIVATPTGSTAYSLSVGGPIVSPDCKNIIITPIAPHNLTVRPIVIPANSEIRLVIESRDDKYMLSVDSKITDVNISDNEIFIKKSKSSIRTLQAKSTNFFDTIRNKLMWGNDTRN